MQVAVIVIRIHFALVRAYWIFCRSTNATARID